MVPNTLDYCRCEHFWHQGNPDIQERL